MNPMSYIRTSCSAALGFAMALGSARGQQPFAISPAEPPQTVPAQGTSAQSSTSAPTTATPSEKPNITPAPKNVSGSDRRRAVKLFLSATKLYQKEQFEDALGEYQKAAALDPQNTQYIAAVEVTRSHAATALIQAAAKQRTMGDTSAARSSLDRAAALDPSNPQIIEHLREMADDVARKKQPGIYEETANGLASPIELAPISGIHSFHLKLNQRQMIRQVCSAYGVDATVDDSVRQVSERLDIDDANFTTVMKALGDVTGSFFVPIDPHRVLVAKDTRENRSKFERTGVETVYLSGLTTPEMTDMGALAKNVFEARQMSVDNASGTLTLRAPELTLNAFNSTFRDLMDGKSQVVLDIRLIQLAHSNTRNTGVTPPQTITAFNVYAEEQSILNANSSLVQEIISSGLASANDPLAILGILLATGQVSSSLFSSGVGVFGGGITQTGVSIPSSTLNLTVNSSDSRELDQYQLRLEDGEEGTLKNGTRYPIMTSSYSALGAGSSAIAGLTSAGSSSSLAALEAQLGGGTSQTIPQIQYEDLGLSLKARPRVLRSGDVALNIDLKITALAGTSLNDIPVLANRSYAGVVTLRQGEGVAIASEVDSSESRAISGTPGLSEIPGLNSITDKNVVKNTSTLLIVVTPRVVRSPQMAGHSPVLRIDRNMDGR